MTNEELMMPRYEQLGLYPACENHGYKKIGDVWTDDGKTPVTNQKGDVAVPLHWEQFPELFRKLYWWEKRKPEEMPQYLKGSEFNGEPLVVMFLDFEYCDNDIDHLMPGWWRGSTHISCFEPATKEEYETYLSNKHKQKK